jgi:hypothetical protein
MYTLIITIYMSLLCSGMRSETTIWQDFILAVFPCKKADPIPAVTPR